jgi:hypothetical protein
VDTIFKTPRVKATTVSVRLWIFSVRINKYQQHTYVVQKQDNNLHAPASFIFWAKTLLFYLSNLKDMQFPQLYRRFRKASIVLQTLLYYLLGQDPSFLFKQP